MPAIVGPIYIMSISGDAAASFGDVFAISPKALITPERDRVRFN